MTEALVVVGTGMAAGRMLDHLTSDAPGAYDITVINAEPRGSYNRILLSPVLAGEKEFSEIVTHDDGWYAARGIATRFGTRVTEIDRDSGTLTTDGGETLRYDRLVLATGSSPVMLPLPGRDLGGVIAYRDREDTEAMMAMGAGRRVVVIGGGLLGLEAAAGMRARGAEVTVVHLMDHLMERQLDGAAAALLRRALRERGIEVLCAARSAAILGENGRVAALQLEDGRELPCDLLVMAVGIRPNVALAHKAGLTVARGIEVDAQMVTSDPAIMAIGECTEFQGHLFGLVAPLYEQAAVAATVLAGRTAAFAVQETASKLKVTGCDLFSAGDFRDGDGREAIVLRDPARGSYRRLVIEDGRLVGAVMYGDTSDGPWFHHLIKSGTDVTAAREALLFGPEFTGEAGPAEPLPPLPSGLDLCGCGTQAGPALAAAGRAA